ncbi:MAG: hypothetical protein LBT68_00345 [Spirochaetales bacterium]|jgi:hypothetical protein|nr:hypothetical protein [Spirochaetales bacterium]
MIDSSRPALSHSKAAGQHSSSGGFFHVRAVAKTPDGTWTLEYGGKTVSVRTAAALTPGAFYKGVFVQKNGYLEFIPRFESAAVASGASAPARRHPPAGTIPQRHILNPEPQPGTRDYSLSILTRAFFHAGRNLPQGSALNEVLTFVHKADKRDVLTRSALAVRCEEKGLSLNADDYETLYAVAEGYSGGGDHGSGGGRRQTQDENSSQNGGNEEAVTASSGDSGGKEGLLLQLFNHLRETDEAWVIYPYRCTMDGQPYAGSLRVLYSLDVPPAAKKHVLAVRSGGGAWHFVWEASGNLKIYYAGSLDRNNLLPAAWVRKFRKLGVYCDDTIYNGDNFDGFDDAPDDLRRINEMA